MAAANKTVWGIHTMDDPLFLNQNLIAIGWEEMGDLSAISTSRDAYKEKYIAAYPDAKKGSIATSAGMLYRFVHEVQEGDYVVFPSKIDRKINIGVVESAYFYEATAALYPNRRKVKWLKHLPRTAFSQGALHEVGSALSFFQVKNYADEYFKALDKDFKGNILEPDTDETVAQTADEIIEAKFLGYYMNAECFHNQMLPFITGIKVSSISKANISTLVLKYPTLVEEQQAIAQVFSDMDDEIAQLEKKLAKYQQIKQGMMQELLTGRIRLVDADGKEQSKTQILQERQPAHNQHFDDAVMIAGIVNAFYSEKYPLGRKKVQKLLYLVRRKEQADISAFHKKAAGPYADEVRYKGGEPIAQKNKYIQVKRNEKGSCFEKGVQMQQALTYLQEWGKQADIDWLVSQFQYTGINELELLATVDMAICDLRREGKGISVVSIKDLIRSNKEWRDKLKKAYFKDADLQRAIKRCQELFSGKEG